MPLWLKVLPGVGMFVAAAPQKEETESLVDGIVGSGRQCQAHADGPDEDQGHTELPVGPTSGGRGGEEGAVPLQGQGQQAQDRDVDLEKN